MIGMAQKEAEEQSTSGELKQSQRLRKAFWTQMLEKFHASDCTLYNNISPSMDHWLCAGSGISGMPYSLIFSKKEIRVELWISRASADINTMALNWLEQHRASVEEVFGNPLEWLSLPGKKSLSYSIPPKNRWLPAGKLAAHDRLAGGAYDPF